MRVVDVHNGFYPPGYVDALRAGERAITARVDVAGADHVLAGSDYPHQIDSLRSMLDAVGGMQLTDRDRAAIFGGNATTLLGRA